MVAIAEKNTLQQHPQILPPEDGNYNPNIVYDIPLSQIFADDEFNCRGLINPVDVLDLAKDIAINGLSQPILVQPWSYTDRHGVEKKFRIVAGYRRYKAHILNKADTIRALVKPGLTDLDARVLNLSENVQRKDLNIMQEALAIDHFRRAGWKEGEVAKRIGVSRGWVQVRYMLLELPSEIQREAEAGLLTQEQIRKVHDLGERGTREDQFEYVRKLKDAKLKNAVREPKAEPKNTKRQRSREELFELQDMIREVFNNNQATRVIAFANGEIDDNEMHSFNYYEAKRLGLFYQMPPGTTLLTPEEVSFEG